MKRFPILRPRRPVTAPVKFLSFSGWMLAAVALPMLIAVPASAQQAGAGPTYSLAQTIEASLANSAEIQMAARTVLIDRKAADAEYARLRPNAAVQGQASQYDDKSRVAIGNSPAIVVAQDHAEVLSVGASLDLDLFGQIRAAASQAKLQSLADQFVLNTIRNQRILTTKAVYYNLLRAEHQVQVAQAALDTAKQQQAIALKLNLGQVGQKIDVLRANTQVANGEQDLLGAQTNRDIARHDFNDLIGRPLDAPVVVQDVSGVTLGVDIGAGTPGAAAPQSTPPYTAAVKEIEGLDLTQSVTTALEHRPEVLTAQVQTRVAETGIKLARAGLEPSFTLSAGGSYYPTTSFQYPRQAQAAITFGFTVPLYDGGATRARVDAARLQTENARTLLERRRKDVALDTRQTYLNLLKSAHQIDAANTALQQAIAARRLAQARYEGQVGLYLEVTDAQAALVQAENSQVNAVYDYLIARAQFENALGTPTTN